jgi:uncharacterized membrane protein YfcA
MMDLRVALILLPAVLVGLWLSTRYTVRVPKRVVRNVILVICAVSAVALVVRGIAG